MIGILLLLIAPTAAQNAPTPVTQLEYTSISDRTLFVRGGVAGLQPVVQFFSLDLTSLVTGTGKPTWKSLSTTHPSKTDYSSQYGMSVTSDNTTLLYISNESLITRYDIDANTWSPPQNTTNPYDPHSTFSSGIRAVTDPSSGLVYIPGTARPDDVYVYNPASTESELRPRLPYADNSTLEYNLAWNRLRGNMMLFGRLNSTIPVLWQMTTTQGGRKMVVFGGRMGTQSPVGDLHFLDLTTTPYTWSNDVTAIRGRAGMACASAGDYFVAWGGSDNTTELPSDILYYNLATKQWVPQDLINEPSFTGTGAPRPTTTNTGSPNNGMPKSTVAALGGGIAAVVAIGSIAVFLILRRRRHRRRPNVPAAAGSGDFSEGQKELYTADGKDYSDHNVVIAPRRAPQWTGTDDQIIFAHLSRKEPQDASQMPMNVYEELGAPHKYLTNQHNGPQQIPLFFNVSNVLFDSHQQQQQPQQDDIPGPSSPQDTSVSAISPVEDSDADPIRQLALIEARHKQKLERIRLQQEADLLKLQQQLEQRNIENKSP
ncbi:hypothetical protein BGX33_010816 [Mortierella sp. NVP41]|nr:hypothetical protein BGX33_010816 [Mortierella sp. NVP41]